MRLELIINLILVVITAIYVGLTYKILQANRQTISEMQKQNESIMRPYINIGVFIPTGSIVFYLRIKNIGKSLANNVKFELDRDFYQLGGNKAGDNIKNFPCFAKQIKCMPPDSEVIFELAQSFVVFGEKTDSSKTPTFFNITAHYDWMDRHYKESSIVDLSPYQESVWPPDPIYEELKGIKDRLDEINQTAGKALGKRLG